MSEIDDLILADADSESQPAKGATDKVLAHLGRLAERRRKMIAGIHALLDRLDQGEKQLAEIEKDIETAMVEAKIRAFTDDAGFGIKLDSFVSVNITEATQREAFDWLKENGHGDIIKTVLAAQFPRGGSSAEMAMAVKDYIEKTFPKANVATDIKESIHAATLGKWAREMNEAGKFADIPAAPFHTYTGTRILVEDPQGKASINPAKKKRDAGKK